MHEAAIAQALVDQVLSVGREHDAVRVQSVEVQVGVMREIAPDALELAFCAAAAGTPAEGAALIIHPERIIAVCRACECLFAPEQLLFECPRCRKADARIVAGNDIILKSVVCEAGLEVSS